MVQHVTFLKLNASSDPYETKQHNCNVEAVTDDVGRGLRIVWCDNAGWVKSVIRAGDVRLLQSGFFDSIFSLLSAADAKLKGTTL